MKQNRITSINGAQLSFYAIGRLAWSIYLENVTDFTAFNPKYNSTYGTNALAAVEAAAALPNIDQRRSGSKTANRKVKAAARKGASYYKKLERYISNAFTADQVEPMIIAAGGNLYASATNGNWQHMGEMLAMAAAFIDKYSTTLSKSGEGMPDSFPAAFTTAKTDYDTVLQAFTVAKKTVQQETGVKTEANNAVYATLMDMLEDGKAIFEDNPDVKKLFTYAALSRIVGKTGRSGVHITVKESDTLLPVTTTTFTFQPGNKTAFVNAKGVADVHLPKGTVSYVATTPGYAPVYGTITISAGVMHRIGLVLQKEAAVA